MTSISLAWPEPDIAVLSIDSPGKAVNVLSATLLQEFASYLDQLTPRTDLAGLIIRSTKPGVFLAGADLHEFLSNIDAPKETIASLCRQGQSLFRRLSECPFLTVAAIDGVCLGGGAELALWCDRRLLSCHPKTEFGLPEVKLGLFPGWGGTVRLPRLIGLANAVEMITNGESLTPLQACRLGLASGRPPSNQLLESAIQIIRAEQPLAKFLREREVRNSPLSISESELYFLAASAAAVIQRETKGNYPAPVAALNLMCETAVLDLGAALHREAEGMARLFGTTENKALLNVFFLTDHNKKTSARPSDFTSLPEIRRVGVAGAGVMGRGIAASCLRRAMAVTLFDPADASLASGTREALTEAAFDRALNGPCPQRILELSGELHAAGTVGELANCDGVVEAIVENAAAKRSLYQKLEAILPQDALIATNTSTLPIASLAEGLTSPDRFCGLHFFNPVRRMKLVEVIRGPRTSDSTVAKAIRLARQLGKFPVVVADGPGFLVNRLLSPYLNEALALVQEGADLRQIDKAATSFGMPVGPLALYDIVGLDTALYAGLTMFDAYRDRTLASPLLPALVKEKRLGQKTGLGFYSYRNKRRRAEIDPNVDVLLAPYVAPRRSFTNAELQNRLLLPMLLEATRMIAEGKVAHVRDIDLGVIFGLGFPAFRGGLLYWADSLGAQQWVDRLKPFAEFGRRFEPTPLLLEMASERRRFYDLNLNQPPASG